MPVAGAVMETDTQRSGVMLYDIVLRMWKTGCFIDSVSIVKSRGSHNGRPGVVIMPSTGANQCQVPGGDTYAGRLLMHRASSQAKL